MTECPECGNEVTHDKPVAVCAACAWDHDPNVNTDPLYSIVLRGRFSPGDANRIKDIVESMHDVDIIRASPMKETPSFYKQRMDAISDFYREYQTILPTWVTDAFSAILANGSYEYVDSLPSLEEDHAASRVQLEDQIIQLEQELAFVDPDSEEAEEMRERIGLFEDVLEEMEHSG